MVNALRFVYLLALVCWIGGIIFFSFIAAPSVFQAVPVDVAGKVVTKIFPRYYLLGHVAGVVALGSGLALARLAGDVSIGRLLPTILVAVMLAIGLYADQGVRTRVESVRAAMLAAPAGQPAPPELKAQFDALHRLSVQLNGATLLLGLVTLFLTAASLKL